MVNEYSNLDLEPYIQDFNLIKFNEKNGSLLGKSASSNAVPLGTLSWDYCYPRRQNLS